MLLRRRWEPVAVDQFLIDTYVLYRRRKDGKLTTKRLTGIWTLAQVRGTDG